MWPFFQRQQSGETVSLYKGGAGQPGHAATAADSSGYTVSHQGVRPVCLAVMGKTHYLMCLFHKFNDA